ncbi:phage capsid protein [uncultured Clostridium sp.]|uniref:phage capsid protein n=1 Tax=uncultured Clostridium sp. TaxID=59620 RepID=UPI003459BF8B
MDIKGISNMSRMKGNDLIEVTSEGRNPDKKYADIDNDNRRSVARRFTRTYLVDSYDKAVQLITDPTSDLFENLKDAKNRMTDKCICDSAIASVTIGAPDVAGTVKTATEDGVETIDGTSKFDYATVISPAITTFTNNYIDCSAGVTLALSGVENQCLRDDDKYMNAFYSSQHTVDTGKITNASGFNVVTFAGSVNGGKTINNPVLPENTGTRSNLLLAPNAIAFAVEIGKLACEPSPTKVNSWEITIDMWVKAVRTEGTRVIILKSTI